MYVYVCIHKHIFVRYVCMHDCVGMCKYAILYNFLVPFFGFEENEVLINEDQGQTKLKVSLRPGGTPPTSNVVLAFTSRDLTSDDTATG